MQRLSSEGSSITGLGMARRSTAARLIGLQPALVKRITWYYGLYNDTKYTVVVFNASTTCNNPTTLRYRFWPKKGWQCWNTNKYYSHKSLWTATTPTRNSPPKPSHYLTCLRKLNNVKQPLFDGRPPSPSHRPTVYSGIKQVYNVQSCRVSKALCSPKQIQHNM